MLYIIVLTVLGLFFIYLEFFLPGMISAFLGIALIVAAVIFMSVAGFSSAALLLYGSVVACLLFFIIRLALAKVKKSSENDTFMLSKDQQGYASYGVDKIMVGEEGFAATDLKPSGLIDVGGVTYQAVSSSFYIDKGVKVQIIATRGSCYVVEALEKKY